MRSSSRRGSRSSGSTPRSCWATPGAEPRRGRLLLRLRLLDLDRVGLLDRDRLALGLRRDEPADDLDLELDNLDLGRLPLSRKLLLRKLRRLDRQDEGALLLELL